MNKTPPKKKKNSDGGADTSLSEVFSPVVVSPGRSPLQGQLTGVPRKVKDTCADWHNVVQKWETLNAKGMAIITKIANLKIQNEEHENPSSAAVYPEGLEKLCKELSDIYTAMEHVVQKLANFTAVFEGVANLEWHQENESFCEEPLFQTWTTDEFYKAAAEVVPMYQRELSVKNTIVESVGHTVGRDTLLLYSTVWLHQPYIEDKAAFILESMLTETGLR